MRFETFTEAEQYAEAADKRIAELETELTNMKAAYSLANATILQINGEKVPQGPRNTAGTDKPYHVHEHIELSSN